MTDQLPISETPMGAGCPVCTRSFNPERGAAITTGCGHQFHGHCLKEWLDQNQNNPTCPNCRGDLTPELALFGLSPGPGQGPAIDLGQNNLNVDPFAFGRNVQPSVFHDLGLSRGFRFNRGGFSDNDEPVRLRAPAIENIDNIENIEIPTADPLTNVTADTPVVSDVADAVDPTVNTELQLTIVPEFSTMASTQTDLFGLLTVEAPNQIQETDSQRPFIDLVVVVDTSGSMGGAKIENVKNTLHFLVEQMQDGDRLSIVLFSSRATILTGLKRLSSEGKVETNAQIDTIRSSGGTKISHGLGLALRVLRERNDAKNPVTSILLLSDGQDGDRNRGQTQIQTYLNNFTDSVSIHTYGYGQDHDSQMLSSISEMGDGVFTYVESDEMINEAIAITFGGLASVCAQNIQLTFTVPDGCEISQLQTPFESQIEGHVATLQIPELIWGARRDIVFQITCPESSDRSNPGPESSDRSNPGPEGMENILFQAQMEYLVPGSDDTVNVETELPVAFASATAEPNIQVNVHRNRMLAAEAMTEARRLADSGELENARTKITEALATLEASPSAQELLVQILIRDLRMALERTRNQRIYTAGGSAALAASSNTHTYQAASTPLLNDEETITSPYLTASQAATTSRINRP